MKRQLRSFGIVKLPLRKSFLMATLVASALLSSAHLKAQQAFDEEQLGAWYMYFFNKKFEQSRFGIQGDYQFRYWDLGRDQEQLLLRTGVTYQPAQTDVLLTLGYVFISLGDFGDSRAAINENRVYQEVLLPQKVGNRLYLTHRFRYEQRWIENVDLRTRFRYNLFVNIPLNKKKIEKNALYFAFYNELFINGERNIGNGNSVAYFDRNRLYAGLGYGVSNQLRLQLGLMEQTTNAWQKRQLQLSLHHNF